MATGTRDGHMRARADQVHFLRGVRTSSANNAPAYGFSLVSAGSYAALQKVHGTPTWLEIFLFLIGGCAGFTAVNLLSTWFFRKESPDEPELVISLATSLSFFSVCASVGAAVGAAFLFPDWWAWLLAPLAYTLTYVAGVGVEIAVAAYSHPEGGVEGERTRTRR